jgi:hypothetical protein
MKWSDAVRLLQSQPGPLSQLPEEQVTDLLVKTMFGGLPMYRVDPRRVLAPNGKTSSFHEQWDTTTQTRAPACGRGGADVTRRNV